MRYVAKKNKGFTLIELLVVMAISVILMGLVLYPVYESFVITRQAQAMVESQDAARTALQAISREMGQAMYVFDNATGPAYIHDLKCQDDPGSDYTFEKFIAGVPAGPAETDAKTPIMLPVPYLDPTSTSGTPTTKWFVLPNGKIDFILPKLYMHCNNTNHDAQAMTPGPRDYPRDIQTGNGSATHLELRDWPPCPYCGSTNVEARPKTPLEQDSTIVRYFLALKYNDVGTPNNAGWVSSWGKNVVDGTQNQVIIYRAEFDPHDNTLFPPDMPLSQRLIDPFFFYRTSTQAKWLAISRVVGIGNYEDLVTATFGAGGEVESVQPTITFRMASIENDTFAPANENDKLSEYPGAPATVFAGSYGYWCPGSKIELMRGNYSDDPATASPDSADYYTAIDLGDLVILEHLPGATEDPVEFDITKYRLDGYIKPPTTGELHMAFDIDENKGTVNFALQPPRPKPSPNGEPASSGPVCSWTPAEINKVFNDVYYGTSTIAPDRYSARRNMQVNTLAIDDLTGGPAYPDQYLKNCRVVPGSDKVIGPDMLPGSHFGQPVRYERVPLGLRYPGQNQYQIDCDTGWIMFSPDPNLALPEKYKDSGGNLVDAPPVEVYYLVYFNKTDDVLRGDYLTKSLINIQMGMRMFDPDQGKPYPVDLTNSVKVRNALR